MSAVLIFGRERHLSGTPKNDERTNGLESDADLSVPLIKAQF